MSANIIKYAGAEPAPLPRRSRERLEQNKHALSLRPRNNAKCHKYLPVSLLLPPLLYRLSCVYVYEFIFSSVQKFRN
jgi:hypothetical protein